MPGTIEPSFIVKADHVDNQRVALPLADGVAHPERRIQELVVCAPVYIDVANDAIVLEHYDHLVRQLHIFYRLGMKIDPRQAGWKTAVHWIVGLLRRCFIRAEDGLGSLVFFLAPSGHGRGLFGKSKTGIRAGTGGWVYQPKPGQIGWRRFLTPCGS